MLRVEESKNDREAHCQEDISHDYSIQAAPHLWLLIIAPIRLASDYLPFRLLFMNYEVALEQRQRHAALVTSYKRRNRLEPTEKPK
jgi:hypothetical protein